MNILMVGSGKGSWEIRGRQLGAALGARVMTRPKDADIRWADVVALIKREGIESMALFHSKPIVWDALDFWPQPDGNPLEEPEARAYFRSLVKSMRPKLVIGSTQAMADACGGFYLPHHSRPGLTPAPARERVEVVGYEGNKKYLGRWAKAVQAECDLRGWQFVINPPDLRECDIVVAFRDGQWDGWMCREWKSGVKIVNAIAAGRPIITQPSAAGREIPQVGMDIDTPDQLAMAFDAFTPHAPRYAAAKTALNSAPEFTLESVAERYRHILQRVVEKAA